MTYRNLYETAIAQRWIREERHHRYGAILQEDRSLDGRNGRHLIRSSCAKKMSVRVHYSYKFFGCARLAYCLLSVRSATYSAECL